MELESWDISGAFLNGFTFERIKAMMTAKGIKMPKRKVHVVPPANVWRHLHALDPEGFSIGKYSVADWVLECLKAMYGFGDAPLAWQLCLHFFLIEMLLGTPSHFDENFWFWKEDGRLVAAMTTHVDDCGIAAALKWLNEKHAAFEKEFGKVSRQKLPFSHCGTKYSNTPTGRSVDQLDFCSKLKEIDIPAGEKDETLVPPVLVTAFRSALGGLLWLCLTRDDLMADVSILQSSVMKCNYGHLQIANQTVRKAKKVANLCLHYRYFPAGCSWRLFNINDSGAASNARDYAQDGILVSLTPDIEDGSERLHMTPASLWSSVTIRQTSSAQWLISCTLQHRSPNAFARALRTVKLCP